MERADQATPTHDNKGWELVGCKGVGLAHVCLICAEHYPPEHAQLAAEQRWLDKQFLDFRDGKGPPPGYAWLYHQPGRDLRAPADLNSSLNKHNYTAQEWMMAKRFAITSGGCWPPVKRLQPPWRLGPGGIRFAPSSEGHLNHERCKGGTSKPQPVVKVHSKGGRGGVQGGCSKGYGGSGQRFS